MWLLLILIITEVLTLVAFRQHFYSRLSLKYATLILVHIILSLWLWILFLKTETYRSFYDSPDHVWLLLNLTGMIFAVVIPRAIFVLFHFSGKLIKIKNGGYIKWLTNTGMIIMVLIFSAIALGTLYGRFNFKTEAVTIKIKGLNKDLDGLKIVQISDLHLSGFYHHKKLLQEVMDDIDAFKPDLILNTGDFVTYGWREFDSNDTILSHAGSRYGNYAVMGNHDSGGYNPDFSEAEKTNNVLIMNNKIKSSGYKVLNDEFTIVKVGHAKIGLIGVITTGRHPDMIYGNLEKAISGLDSADIKILLSHDPNHWAKSVTGKTDIDLTLSGHTHGMQMGIISRIFRWSPSKYFYPHWNGLYSDGDQFQYVNRGLGVLSIPFRICMPPEITLITLKPE
jgi:uncharacterized protein